jgi:hypothetical protein
MIIGYISNTLGIFILFFPAESIALAIIVYWIKITYYNDQKSAFKLIEGIIIISTIVIMPFAYEMTRLTVEERQVQSTIINIIHGIVVLLVGYWFFNANRVASQTLKLSKTIEPWLKTRYHYLTIESISLIVIGISFIFAQRTITYQLNWAYNLLFFANFVMILIEALAWIMPPWLKKIYNGKWIPLFDEKILYESQLREIQEDQTNKGTYTETKSIEIQPTKIAIKEYYPAIAQTQNSFNFISENLASLIGKPILTCRGIIRIAIKEKFQFKMAENLSLNELHDVIQVELLAQLQKMKILNPELVSEKLLISISSIQSMNPIAF